ncbi:hypothetical protein KVR01_006531 [Diaporthe batatas]|uniref:uncharacterized protein n=1 Tax=Diaporthe batatas TaxID=748121 RepID=UPI001D05923E|nr:uncharacterized protein KVR01_006531 [Diaporthe batatas]KAG8163234.1 hypothetical protein KVR01_006531 [Diaporthe batatas]
MSYQLGITSMSLGRATAGHSFTHKLNMAVKYGYKGIELFYEDLCEEAASRFGNGTTPPSKEAQLEAARHIRALCAERDLFIICLQPFAHYEGLVDRKAHDEQIEKLYFWIDLAHELGTDMIQVPSSFLPAEQVSEDMNLIVSDLQKIADIGAAASPPIRYVYESLCWGTRSDLWETSWEIVKKIDRDNFGLCLDSFNIAGRIYADPCAASGKCDNAEEVVRESMERLVREMKPHIHKVFYVQVVDAERLSAPLVPGHAYYNAEQPARMSWSRNCRLFYGEAEYGAYLPVREICETFFNKLNFKGWVSLELFNRRMGDTAKEVPEELARRGAISWRKLIKDMRLTVDEPAPVPYAPVVSYATPTFETAQKAVSAIVQGFRSKVFDFGK